MILVVAGVEFRYDSRPVLRGVRFALEAGELLAILGPNGVGKTTLLKCINANLRPAGGSVLVDGRDVLRMGAAEIARRVGYVAQRTEAARLTVFDAVLLGRRPHLGWRLSADDLRLAASALERLGLAPLAMRFIDRLSGGELQKVAIARALVQHPRLLLLDEPTSSLDLRNQIDTLRLIRQAVAEHGIAAVMTMHDLNRALGWADKFLFLKDGAVFAAGRSTEVTAEMVAAVYGVPVEIHRHRGRPWIIPLDPSEDERRQPMPSGFPPETIDAVIRFHGHMCPGLAIGIRAAEIALEAVGRDGDEEIVAVVETDMCGVDAIQFLTGCTFGKGNLIHRDYGKNAFSFFRRADGKSLRIVAAPAVFGEAAEELAALHRRMVRGGLSAADKARWQALREGMTARVMESPREALFEIKPVQGPAPQPARILASRLCDACGEPVMETRLREHGGRRLCAPCFETDAAPA